MTGVVSVDNEILDRVKYDTGNEQRRRAHDARARRDSREDVRTADIDVDATSAELDEFRAWKARKHEQELDDMSMQERYEFKASQAYIPPINLRMGLNGSDLDTDDTDASPYKAMESPAAAASSERDALARRPPPRARGRGRGRGRPPNRGRGRPPSRVKGAKPKPSAKARAQTAKRTATMSPTQLPQSLSLNSSTQSQSKYSWQGHTLQQS